MEHTVRVREWSMDAYRRALTEAGVALNAYAEELLPMLRPGAARRVTVETLTLVELGLPDGAVYREILEAGRAMGLRVCAPSLAMDLRLDWLDQPEGPYLTVASERAFEDDMRPCGLYLRRLDGTLWLRGYRATRDYVWPAESCFAFERPEP